MLSSSSIVAMSARNEQVTELAVMQRAS